MEADYWGGGNEMKLKKPLIGSVILYVSERERGSHDSL